MRNQVDILVNNAGLALGTSPVQDNVIEDIRCMLETNVLGVVAFTKAFTGGMITRNRLVWYRAFRRHCDPAVLHLALG